MKEITKHGVRDGFRGFNIHLPVALADELIALAMAEDRPVSNMLRVMLRECLAARAAKQAPQ